MNYLAHIFLSGKDRQIQIGNFVGDAVKGNAYRNYPPGMQKGILLHRQIDAFSDTHPVVREMVALGRGYVGRYAAVVTDILLDYILARDFKTYAHRSLKRFAYGFYWNLLWAYPDLSVRFRRFMWHFILTDRLGAYATVEGIRRSLAIMVEYRNLRINPDKAVELLLLHEREWTEAFKSFFPELQEMCQRVLVRDTTIILNS